MRSSARRGDPSRLFRMLQLKQRGPVTLTFRAASTAQNNSMVTDWKRWQSLDVIDERERLDFSMFVGKLQDKFKHLAGNRKMDDDDESLLFLQRPHRTGITFPEEIKMSCVKNLLQDLEEGKQLSLQLMHNIVDHATPVLAACDNVVHVPQPADGERVIVVGDLHGSLADLLHIFERFGLPSSSNKYIFNGDFVDRGIFGLEVLMVLLSCKVAAPDAVFLNRGNHEDRLLCTAYGFHSEVLAKANKHIFQQVCGIFALLPLVTVVDKVALVVHGGLPSYGDPQSLLADVATVPRAQWQTMQRVELANLSEKERTQLLLMKDLLWSDPEPSLVGIAPSPRGAGCVFGNDVVHTYLSQLELPHLVRSHQCVIKGFETTPVGEYEHHTVFSASNYCGSQNLGAVVVLSVEDGKVERGFETWVPPQLSNSSISRKTEGVMNDTIHSIKLALENSYEQSGLSRLVTMKECNQIIERAVGAPMPWKHVLDAASEGEIGDPESVDKVDFVAFLNNYENFSRSRGQLSFEGAHMYKQLKLVQAMFSFFDTDQDGVITKQEFIEGVEVINDELEDQHRFDGERFFALLDFDGSGRISLNEMCEGYRIARIRVKS